MTVHVEWGEFSNVENSVLITRRFCTQQLDWFMCPSACHSLNCLQTSLS